MTHVQILYIRPATAGIRLLTLEQMQPACSSKNTRARAHTHTHPGARALTGTEAGNECGRIALHTRPLSLQFTLIQLNTESICKSLEAIALRLKNPEPKDSRPPKPPDPKCPQTQTLKPKSLRTLKIPNPNPKTTPLSRKFEPEPATGT